MSKRQDNLKAFLKHVAVEKVEFVASTNFKDDEGNPIQWLIKQTSADEKDALMKECTLNSQANE